VTSSISASALTTTRRLRVRPRPNPPIECGLLESFLEVNLDSECWRDAEITPLAKERE